MKYRKKPVVIEAIQWTGKNEAEILNFFKTDQILNFNYDPKPTFQIKTLEGTMSARIGDYIIKGVEGEMYPCKPGIFEKTYEPVE